jgi:uncharacterized phage-like protein YoqJ
LEKSVIKEKSYTACVFTGHRELGVSFSIEELRKAIITRINQGVTVFYNGVARGFDLLAAKEVLSLKKEYDIKLVACVPYRKQAVAYTPSEKALYDEILKNADEVAVLTENYYKGCLLRRNDYMIERSDCMIAYLTKDEGGTAYTVRNFRKKVGDHIIFVGK